MAEIQTGFFWHVHHEVLIEWCYDYDGRASFIRSEKRENEQETRLRLFKPVKGILPQEVVEAGQALDEAWRARVEAGQALDEAWEAYAEARRISVEADKAYYKAGQALDRARRAYVEARRARDEADKAHNKAQQAHNEAWRALDTVLRKNRPAIEALHKEECHGCSWDGKTIFPGS